MRQPTIRTCLTLAFLSLSAPAALHAQQPVEAEITGHILEPQRLSPTDERVAQGEFVGTFQKSE